MKTKRTERPRKDVNEEQEAERKSVRENRATEKGRKQVDIYLSIKACPQVTQRISEEVNIRSLRMRQE